MKTTIFSLTLQLALCIGTASAQRTIQFKEVKITHFPSLFHNFRLDQNSIKLHATPTGDLLNVKNVVPFKLPPWEVAQYVSPASQVLRVAKAGNTTYTAAFVIRKP